MKVFLLLSLVALAACLVIPEGSKQYIVVFKKGLSNEIMEAHRSEIAEHIASNWSMGEGFNGFGAHLTAEHLAKQESHPNVDYIEENQEVHISQTCTSQSRATWGINRVSTKPLNLDGVYKYGTNGQGVTVYVLDTGIRITHNDFGGRAVWGANFAGDGVNSDCEGHGTHVAGTVGSTTYGIAKKVTLVAVKVLDCGGSGSNFGIMDGMNWVLTNARGKLAVVNMSLGGGFSRSENQAAAALVSAGITTVVAAGNDNRDACGDSPGSERSVITVGSTDWRDIRSDFSNWGSCLDIFGPGSDITSLGITSNSAIDTMSGTSMASPHVAGVAALILAQNPRFTPSQVQSTMMTTSSSGIIRMSCQFQGCTSSPNNLLFKGC